MWLKFARLFPIRYLCPTGLTSEHGSAERNRKQSVREPPSHGTPILLRLVGSPHRI